MKKDPYIILTPMRKREGSLTDVTIQLNVNDIKQYDYCERIPFYKHHLRGDIYNTAMMNIGREYEDKINDAQIINGFSITYGMKVVVFRHMRLYDAAIGLNGILDYAILCNGIYYPLEIKFSEKPEIYTGQLAAYALLLGQRYRCKINKGYFYYSYGFRNTLKESAISISDKLAVLKKLEAIRKNLSLAERPKPTTNFNKCVHCEYRNFCNDVI